MNQLHICIALFSGTAFALEIVLATKLYRSLPARVFSSLRGLSFSITMLPLLAYACGDFVLLTPRLAGILSFAAAATYTGNVLYGVGMKNLSAGIATALSLSGIASYLTAVLHGDAV